MGEITVREFRKTDGEGFLALGRFLQENGNYKNCGFNPLKVLLLFTYLVEKNPDYFGVIAETEEGRIVGAFVGRLENYYFSDEKIASDLCFGLMPGFRDTSKEVMTEMISRFEQWAIDAGALEASISPSVGMHGNKLEPFLNETGYTTVGFSTKKRIT